MKRGQTIACCWGWSFSCWLEVDRYRSMDAQDVPSRHWARDVYVRPRRPHGFASTLGGLNGGFSNFSLECEQGFVQGGVNIENGQQIGKLE